MDSMRCENKLQVSLNDVISMHILSYQACEWGVFLY